MWVFDGEEWVEEGASSTSDRKPTTVEKSWPAEQFYPELQIVEVPLVRERLPEPPPLIIVP